MAISALNLAASSASFDAAGRSESSRRCSCGVAQKGRDGRAFNEEAFQYLLDVEQRRSEHSRRPFLLLLADVRTPVGTSRRLERSIASDLLSCLWRCLRDTDFVGWYRDQRVAGAILTQHGEVSGAVAAVRAFQRVQEAFAADLPPHVAQRLQVRVYQVPPGVGD